MDFDDDGNTIQPIILPIAPPAAQVQRGNISNIARKSTIDEFREREIVRSYIGTMDQICPHCQARYWHAELNAARLYTRCCQNDTVRIPALTPPPAGIEELFLGKTADSKKILKKSRAFNTKASFASITVQEDKRFTHTAGIPTFRISGTVYHRLGAINNEADMPPQFLQCYFYDQANEENFFNFDVHELAILQRIRTQVLASNPFIQTLKVWSHQIIKS